MFSIEEGKEKARAILKAAVDVSASEEIPPELRQAAFEKAVDVLIELDTAMGPPAKDAVLRDLARPAAESAGRTADEGTALDKIAARLKVSRDTVGEVLDVEDGKIDVIAPTSKFDSRKAPAAKQLALLVAGARQAADMEEWTDIDSIRPIVDDFKRYDSANFATTIKEMEDVFRVKQNGRTITVRMGRPGWDAMAELVRKLGGEDDR
jgi:hypothetical protein